VLRTFLSSVFGDTAPLETPKGDAEASKLQWMPDYNFQAFIRRDVSTFWVEKNPAFTGQAGKFLNLSDRRLDLYWDDNGNGR